MTPMQKIFFGVSITLSISWLLLYALNNSIWFPLALVNLAYTLIGLYDIYLSPHTLNRLYPVAAYLRYGLEHIRPEIQQYFIASNTNESPFNREMRTLVYARAKGQRDTIPFGTQRNILEPGFYSLPHSLAPKHPDPLHSRVIIGNGNGTRSYSASRFNVSAMSFGALSANAISALNIAAREGDFYHNTGEGGISPYHQKGGDLVWQIGTGYFGCRHEDGSFNPDLFKEKAISNAVKMIEIKLSQGAKPAHGGVLPGAKVSQEIADIRHVPVGKTVYSPASHSAFDSPKGLLKFLEQLRNLSQKPVGFKLCIGNKSEFMSICKAMLETQIIPDFITIDGAEGGTGAAPVEFSNRLGLSCIEAVYFAHNTLVGAGLRHKVKIIAAGKTASGYELLSKIAVGADIVNSARTMMFALGCIQSLSCNTNHCPTGIATQDPSRSKALDIPLKSTRVKRYQQATIQSFLELVGAIGLSSVEELGPQHLLRRMDNGVSIPFDQLFPQLKTGELLGDEINEEYALYWGKSSAEKF